MCYITPPKRATRSLKEILLASANFCQVNPAQLVCVCLCMLFLFTVESTDIEAKVNNGIALMFSQVNEILNEKLHGHRLK